MKKLLTFLLCWLAFAPAWAYKHGSAVTPTFTPAWQTAKLGGGGFTNAIQIFPDGTKLARTDTNGFYLWAGSVWQQLITTTSLPSGDVQDIINGGDISGSEITACAYTTQSSATLTGSTNTLYAVWNAAIYKSTSQGASGSNTGQAVAGASGNDPTQKEMDPNIWCDPASGGQIAYVSVPGAAPLFTLNGGSSWATASGITAPTSPHGSLIASDPTSAVVSGATQTFYISSYGTGVYKTTNGGSSFSLTSGTPTNLSAMWVDQFGVLWAIDYAGTSVHKFSSGTWSTPTSPGGIGAFAIDPVASSEATEHIVALNNGGEISSTTNGGSSWSSYVYYPATTSSQIPWIAAAGGIAGGPSSPTYLNVGKAGFDTSSNLFTGTGVGAFSATAPVANSSAYVTATAGIEQLVTYRLISPPGLPSLTSVADRGVFIQSNPDDYPAAQWTELTAIAAGRDVAYATGTPSTITTVTNSQIGSGDYSAFSTDGGNSWTRFTTLPNGSTLSGGMIAADSATDWIDVPGQGQNLYCTTNGSTSWAVASLPGSPTPHWLNNDYLDRHVLAADPSNAGTLYAYNSGDGVYSTTTGCGGTWTKVFSGYISPSATEGYNSTLLAVPGQTGHLCYTEGWNSGTQPDPYETFVCSTNGGASWPAVTNVLEVSAFGFGAAKPGGGGQATVYIAGWVSGVYGVWYSTDNMSTWTQIGPYPQGNPGIPSEITGDPDVYGRVIVGYGGGGNVYYDTIDACPWVSFTAPNPTNNITGTYNITAAHSGLVPITSVQFSVDGTNIGSSMTGSGPYSYAWPTGGVATGAHTLKVTAVGNGCTDSKSISIITH